MLGGKYLPLQPLQLLQPSSYAKIGANGPPFCPSEPAGAVALLVPVLAFMFFASAAIEVRLACFYGWLLLVAIATIARPAPAAMGVERSLDCSGIYQGRFVPGTKSPQFRR